MQKEVDAITKLSIIYALDDTGFSYTVFIRNGILATSKNKRWRT